MAEKPSFAKAHAELLRALKEAQAFHEEAMASNDAKINREYIRRGRRVDRATKKWLKYFKAGA
jgi:hypothetical protein